MIWFRARGVFASAVALTFELTALAAWGFAPTLSGAPAWGEGSTCRQLRGDRSDLIDLAFTPPSGGALRGVHLRLAPSSSAAAGGGFVVRLESDAGGLPSGQALATAALVPSGDPWVFVPLGPLALGGEQYHLTLTAPADGVPASRLCYLKHVGDPARSTQPWSVTARDESTLAPTGRGWARLEPIFVLEFADGSLWGQPYNDTRDEVVSTETSLSWTFASTRALDATYLVARLHGRGRGAPPRFRLSNAAGVALASGSLLKTDGVPDWSSAYHAAFAAPLGLAAGERLRLTLDVPPGGGRARYLHRTPTTDFPRALPASVARDGSGRPSAPSILLGTAQPDVPHNLAPNPSFELDPATDYFTHSEDPAQTTFTRASDAHRGGARSIKIVSRQPDGSMSRWLSRNERIAVTPGERYAASFWVKTSRVSGEATVALNFWDGTAWNHLGTTTSITRMQGTSDWTKLEASATAPPGARYLRVEARLVGPGTLWADDVLVADVEQTPSASPTPQPAPTPTPTRRPASPTPGPLATATPRPTRTASPAPTPQVTRTPRPSVTPQATPAGSSCSGRLNVSPTGNDANDGSVARPLRTIQRAANLAAPGDTVCVAAGTYRERVRITRPGASGAPIVFQGAAGAVVDGGDRHDGGWVHATEFGTNAQGVYPVWKKQIVFGDGSTPYHGTLAGKYILRLRDTDNSGNAFMSSCAESPSSCPGGDRLRNGPRGYNTANATGTVYQSWSTPGTVDAFFGVDGGWTYIAFKDGRSPNGRDLTFAPKNAGALQVEASWITVRGFVVRGANYPVYLPSSSAHHVTIEGNTIRNGFFGVFLAGGAHDNVVRGNDVSIEYGSSLHPSDPWKWFTWNAFRNNSQLHRASISMSGGGAANEIVGNVIHDAFSGIDEDGSTPAGDGVRVHHNTIRTCMNDGLTITGGSDSRWFDNTMSAVNIGTRFWPFGDGGTVSYYRNRIDLPDSKLVEACLFFFRGSSSDTLRVYHNSCSAPLGLLFGSTNVAPGLPKLRIYDNLFSVRSLHTMNDWSGWSANFANASRRPDVAYNWASTAFASWMAASNVTGSGLLWPLDATPTWLLDSTLGASAKSIGYDVTRSNATLGTPWAGFAPGYFDGAAPDAGAVQAN